MISQAEAYAHIQCMVGNYEPLALLVEERKQEETKNRYARCECHLLGAKCLPCKTREEYNKKMRMPTYNYTPEYSNNYYDNKISHVSFADKELSKNLHDYYFDDKGRDIKINDEDKEYDYFENEYSDTDVGSLTDESIKDIYACVADYDGVIYIDITEASSYENLSHIWTKISDDTLARMLRIIRKYDDYIDTIEENIMEDTEEDTFDTLEIYSTQCHVSDDKIREKIYMKLTELID